MSSPYSRNDEARPQAPLTSVRAPAPPVLQPPLFAVVQVRVTGPDAALVMVKVLPEADFAAIV